MNDFAQIIDIACFKCKLVDSLKTCGFARGLSFFLIGIRLKQYLQYIFSSILLE